MESLSKDLAEWLDWGPFWNDIIDAVMIALVAVVVVLVAMLAAGLLTWGERRVSGRTQSRVGPNRVGPLGLLQFVADAVKLLLKEDVIPDQADRPLFRLAPYPVMIGVLSAFAVIPFAPALIASDLNVGVLYLLAITSLVVVGILMGGWASNNKWSLFGGVRAAAQIVSYEIPIALSILIILMLSGSLSLNTITQAQGGFETGDYAVWYLQGGWPWNWYIFHNPFTFIAFFVYFIAAVAEGNRTPFDLPEAESELVAGYNTEYSGFRFAGFFLGEFANIFLLNTIATTLFFGGWQVPGFTSSEQAASPWLQFIGLAIFVAKAAVGSFVVLWMRWTLPRMRIDQMMGLCYRYLVPIGFFCLFGVAVYLLIIPQEHWLNIAVHVATAGLGFLVVAIFFRRVFHHVKSVGDRFSLFEFLQRGKKYAFDPSVQVRRYGSHRKGAKEAR